VLRRATDLLRTRFRIYFSTLQIEQVCQADEEEAAAIDITGKAGGHMSGGGHSTSAVSAGRNHQEGQRP
jgi:cobalt-zinc-cadmium efflux system protein